MPNAPITRLLDLLTLDNAFGFLKLLYLFGILLYIIFALVMIRQVEQMVQTLNGNFDLPLRVMAIAHFLLAVGLFLLALVVL